jgi:hypothetical protein
MNDFKNIKIPHKNLSDITDYMELICICNPDHMINISEACSEICNENKYTKESDNEEDFEFSGDYNTKYIPKDTLVMDIKNYIGNKIFQYNEYYPFSLQDSTMIQKIKMTVINKMYVYFLLCSNLYLMKKKKLQNILTSDFERISSLALKSHLQGFNVHRVGRSLDKTEFPANFFELVKKMSDILNEKHIMEKNDKRSSSGDGGIDLFAYKNAGDKCPGSITIFAQCACQKDDWHKKKHDVSHTNWKFRISFCHDPVQMLMVPHNFRDNSWEWEENDKISGCILLDRYRLCMHLSGKEIGDIDSLQIVEKFLNHNPEN